MIAEIYCVECGFEGTISYNSNKFEGDIVCCPWCGVCGNDVVVRYYNDDYNSEKEEK